ncbi:MAG: NTP transferase domain-containing protein, partial [Vicinamibacteria bacterium]|nr:NTP transferase domain-containing protein [Vicinamibacteria bacterium]
MIYGIVLAAGLGRRLGGPKALVSLGGLTFHRRAVGAFRQADHEVVVVINAQVREALPEPDPGERRVINPNPDQAAGMFASVRLGLAAVQGKGAKGVVLLPVDHPLVTGEDIRAVADALRNGAAIAVATHGGRRGHPI